MGALFDVLQRPTWGPSAKQPGDWGTRDGLDASLQAAAAGRPILLNLRCPTLVVAFAPSKSIFYELPTLLAPALSKCAVRLIFLDHARVSNFSLSTEGGRTRWNELCDEGCIDFFVWVLWVQKQKCVRRRRDSPTSPMAGRR